MGALIRGRGRAAVLGTALLVAVGLGVFLSSRAPASPSLPSTSGKDLVTNAIKALAVQPSVSGDAQVHVDLGIPQLPSADGETPATGLLALLSSISGDHQLRVWSSKDGVRIAEILPAAERSVFANRHDVWLWDSTDVTAYHVVVPPAQSRAEPTPEPSPSGSPAALDPTALAGRFLASITPSTTVSVADPTTVAGEPVYPLELVPNDSHTLVGRVEIDIDANTWVPLRVAVYPRGSNSAALSAGFTDVSFAPIDSSTYDFTPPPGVTVKTITPPAKGGTSGETRDASSTAPEVKTFGRDWTEVVAVRLPQQTPSAPTSALGQVERLLPFSGPLLSVDLVSRADGRWIVAGMVPPSALGAAEAGLP